MELKTSGCQIGTTADRGEIAAESLGSFFLMHNTYVHSFVYFAGILRKPYGIPQAKKSNCLQVTKLLNIYKLTKQKAR